MHFDIHFFKHNTMHFDISFINTKRYSFLQTMQCTSLFSFPNTKHCPSVIFFSYTTPRTSILILATHYAFSYSRLITQHNVLQYSPLITYHNPLRYSHLITQYSVLRHYSKHSLTRKIKEEHTYSSAPQSQTDWQNSNEGNINKGTDCFHRGFIFRVFSNCPLIIKNILVLYLLIDKPAKMCKIKSHLGIIDFGGKIVLSKNNGKIS